MKISGSTASCQELTHHQRPRSQQSPLAWHIALLTIFHRRRIFSLHKTSCVLRHEHNYAIARQPDATCVLETRYNIYSACADF